MQFRSIIRIVGLLLALFSVSMLAPAFVALIYRDGAGVPFVSTFLFCCCAAGYAGFPIDIIKKRFEVPRWLFDCSAVLDGNW